MQICCVVHDKLAKLGKSRRDLNIVKGGMLRKSLPVD